MKGDSGSGRHAMLPAMLGLTLPLLGAGAFADAPSNAILIAAMPPGTDSVMVQRVSTFEAAESIFHDEYDRASPTSSTNKNIKTVVRNAIQLAHTVAFAWGASEFQMPPDTGMTGNYNERAVYVVEETLAELRGRLDARRDVEGVDEQFDVAGIRIYKGTIDDKSVWGWTHNSAGEAWFVAIPDDHTVVSAESRSDIEHMLKSLKEKKSTIPHRWREIALGHNLDSPLVILRQYPPPEENGEPSIGLFIPPPDTGTTHFALTLPEVRAAVTRISVKAKNVDKAIAWYKRQFLSESQYVWNVERNDTGVTGTLGPKSQGEKPKYMTFSWILLFGPCVMV